jgi:hypothetical protein
MGNYSFEFLKASIADLLTLNVVEREASCADLLQEFKKVSWRLLVVSSLFNNFLG